MYECAQEAGINRVWEFPVMEVLGSRVPVLDLKQSVDVTDRLVKLGDGRCRQIINTGFHGIWMGRENPEMLKILNAAEFWVPDGIAFALIARAHGYRMKRIAGPEYVEAVLRLSCERGYRHYFYGESPNTLDALHDRLTQKFANIKIAGMFSPPFRPLTQEEDDAHVAEINRAAPDILWVGLGCPKQERWIYEHKHRLHSPVAVGIGAIFGFLSGVVSRAPGFIGAMGMEWLWRLAHEPRKCWRRCLIDGPRFVCQVGSEIAGRKNGNGTNSRRSANNY